MPPVPGQHFGGGLLPPLGTHLSFLHSSRPRETPEQALGSLKQEGNSLVQNQGVRGQRSALGIHLSIRRHGTRLEFPPPPQSSTALQTNICQQAQGRVAQTPRRGARAAGALPGQPAGRALQGSLPHLPRSLRAQIFGSWFLSATTQRPPSSSSPHPCLSANGSRAEAGRKVASSEGKSLPSWIFREGF